MGTDLEGLLELQTSKDMFDVDQADVVALQLDAANERLQTRIDDIPLLRNRADDGGVTKVAERADLVPLLFAHSAYKSYGESWLADGKWTRMTKWVRTVSTLSGDVDIDGVTSLDDFVERLQSAGCYVSCSSGTTGKPAMIPSSKADLGVASRSNVQGLSWATGIEPDGQLKMMGLGPQVNLPRNLASKDAMIAAFSSPERAFQMPLPPILPSSMIDMVLMRRRIAEGVASPSEVAKYEATSGDREAALAKSTDLAVDELIESRDQRLLLGGMYASLYDIAERVRAKGYSGTDFTEENAMFVAGGLKGNTLPENYRAYITETFNVPEQLNFSLYSMQEINTSFPKCRAQRYHVPPWVMVLPLDEPGERLLDGDGEIEGRAAFFDLSLDGRWGGVISGDRVFVRFGACECGHGGPTIGQDIVRYSDTVSGDKISCAGNIDAYVRGEA